MRALGIWDVIFSHEVVPVIEGTKNWEADHEEKVKALKKLNIDTSKLEEEVVITDVEDPIRLVGIATPFLCITYFCEIDFTENRINFESTNIISANSKCNFAKLDHI